MSAVFAKAFIVVIMLSALTGLSSAACTVSATSVTFGTYDVLSPSPLLSTGSITVDCDPVSPGDVSIALGQSPGAGFNPRQMKHASLPDRLNYNLFTDASLTAIWGDGSAGTTMVTTPKVHKNFPRTLTVSGRIPQAQDVSAGLYADVLTVTIIF